MVRYNGAKSTEFAGIAESVRVIDGNTAPLKYVAIVAVPVIWHVLGAKENPCGIVDSAFKAHV